MTDEQIIYALERCSQHKECCYCNAVEECGNKRVLTESVLDLINRQKAEIEEKDIEIDILIRKKDAAYDEISELRAEVERLKEENKNQKLVIEEIEDILDPLPFETDFKKAIKTAKSEAIKEFAKKLKEKIYSQVIRKKIDYTVEEMVGD